jgi:hypothetical protein
MTGWPKVMLLLLAEKARVGADLTVESAELEPQPVNAIRGAIAANQNRIFEHVASGPDLPGRDGEGCRSRLLLRVLLRHVRAVCIVFLLKRKPSTTNILATTGPRPFSIHFGFSINAKLAKPVPNQTTWILGCILKVGLEKMNAKFDSLDAVNKLLTARITGFQKSGMN